MGDDSCGSIAVFPVPLLQRTKKKNKPQCCGEEKKKKRILLKQTESIFEPSVCLNINLREQRCPKECVVHQCFCFKCNIVNKASLNALVLHSTERRHVSLPHVHSHK